MTMAVLTWLIAIPLLGVVTGLRTFTSIMVLCWFAYRGDLPVDGTWTAWTGHLVTAVILSVLAVGEYIGDKLPRAQNRTAPGPLVARVVVGGLIGAIAATSLDGSLFEGIFLGAAGALMGAFAGYLIRRDLVEKLGCKDWHVAVAEDIFAVVCAVLAMGVVTG